MTKISQEEFETKFLGEPNSGCWLWLGAMCGKYGRFGTPSRSVHRIAYELYVEAIPCGLFICHKCDTPSCVNPSHLYVGTAKDNSNDKWNRGRANIPFGERHYKAKLTKEDVVAIRSSPLGLTELAKIYGCSKVAIHYARNRRNWRSVS
jgi:hypothetical protein